MATQVFGGMRWRGVGRVALAMVVSASIFSTLSISASEANATTQVTVQSAKGTVVNASSSFNPGRIISDENFYGRSAMTESQIQSFLATNSSVLANYRSSVASRPTVTSSRTGNLVCNPFMGGDDLLASTIIFRAQAACNISAKVILVTLQKEQSLITRSTATSTQFRIAMGYGCPDTAPCDVRYYGFGNQVYEAARQLNNYKEGRFARQPGVHTIGWHPNASCGATTFTIENYATAALYNYTPYRPNQAALDNTPGIGDSCSSYGNRNFWYFYNRWFGASVVIDGRPPIAELYTSMGGAEGALGTEAEASACAVGMMSCWVRYANGLIGWTHFGGAYVVSGDMLNGYLSRGGPSGTLRLPIGPSSPFTDSVNGDGVVQIFEGGYLYASAAGVFRVVANTPIANLWAAEGWIRGTLGWPISDETCNSGACSQEFQGGYIGRTSAGSAFIMQGSIEEEYRARGGSAGALGQPMSPASAFTSASNGNGDVQIFQGGYLYSSASGVFLVRPNTPQANLWAQEGWIRGDLGWPTSNEQCVAGACTQLFQGGVIGWQGSQVYRLTGPILDYFVATGGAEGPLGNPLAIAVGFGVPSNGNGSVQVFQGGYVYSSEAGVFTVKPGTPLANTWASAGWIRGALGWPVAEEQCVDGVCSQRFQGGTVTGSTIVLDVTDPTIASYWTSRGGADGDLGNPIRSAAAFAGQPSNGNGLVQIFEGGYVYSSHAGVFTVKPGTLLANAWAGSGWVRGPLGWPSAEEVCSSGVCTQDFQGGSVRGSTVIYGVTDSVIAAYWAARGGAEGALGDPIGNASPFTVASNGNGIVQVFEGGYVYSSESGVFTVRPNTPIANAWAAAGWIRGTWGWPVAEEACSEGLCSQQFQGGVLAR